jgi:putative transposase
MAIEAIYRRPNTSKPAPGHEVYPICCASRPYLLRKPALSAAQAGGDAAQPGLGDGHHRYPHGARLRLSPCPRRLGHRRLVQPAGAELATVDHAGDGFCIESLEEALTRFGAPEIFNTDQGSQFTNVPPPDPETSVCAYAASGSLSIWSRLNGAGERWPCRSISQLSL